MQQYFKGMYQKLKTIIYVSDNSKQQKQLETTLFYFTTHFHRQKRKLFYVVLVVDSCLCEKHSDKGLYDFCMRIRQLETTETT